MTTPSRDDFVTGAFVVAKLYPGESFAAHGLTIGKKYEIVRSDIISDDTIKVKNDDGYTEWYDFRHFELWKPPVSTVGGFRLAPSSVVNHRSSRKNYERLMSKAKWVKVGSGHFSSVWAKSNTSTHVYKFGTLNDGWTAYASLVMRKHRNNPYAPKIVWIKWFGEGENKWWIAKIERLAPIDSSEQPAYKHYMKAYNLLNWYNNPAGREAYVKTRRKDPKLLALVEDIRSELLINFSLDFHSENAMARGDTMVITDPIAGRHSNTRRRGKS